MIAHLRGRLIEKHPTHLIVECGGVGYQVQISLNSYTAIPDEESCLVYTHFVVREDAQLLYGFADTEEREMFRLLISVSGVGASTAILILSSLTAADVRNVIASEDVATLKSVKGIGAKSAQRIIVDLKDKVGLITGGVEISVSKGNSVAAEALSALLALGFDKGKSEKMIQSLDHQNMSVEEVIKTALKSM